MINDTNLRNARQYFVGLRKAVIVVVPSLVVVCRSLWHVSLTFALIHVSIDTPGHGWEHAEVTLRPEQIYRDNFKLITLYGPGMRFIDIQWTTGEKSFPFPFPSFPFPSDHSGGHTNDSTLAIWQTFDTFNLLELIVLTYA